MMHVLITSQLLDFSFQLTLTEFIQVSINMFLSSILSCLGIRDPLEDAAFTFVSIDSDFVDNLQRRQ